MNEYQFVLPYPPSVNTYWRRRGSQYYISDKGQKYRKDVQQIIRQLKLDIFTKSRLRIKVIADVPDSRRRDLDNILKGLLDSLIHAGFAEDDEQFDDIRVIRGVKVQWTAWNKNHRTGERMNATIQTIPELLIQTRGNQTEVARMLSCARGTVLKYNRDSKGERHVIVNGVLMVKQGKRGRR